MPSKKENFTTPNIALKKKTIKASEYAKKNQLNELFSKEIICKYNRIKKKPSIAESVSLHKMKEDGTFNNSKINRQNAYNFS